MRVVDEHNALVTAIAAGNLNSVQRIIGIRDDRGVPLVDLNHHFNLNHFGGVSFISGTALSFALRCPRVNTDIFESLLMVRDNERNVVIDLNQTTSDGGTLVKWLLQAEMEIITKRRLLQSLIDTRGPNGELILDLRADTETFGLLHWALNTKDTEILRMLLDARCADGTLALDVNRHAWQETILDVALNRDVPEPLIQTIRDAGGQRYRELPAAVQARRPPNRPVDQLPRPAPVVVPVARQATAAVEEFERRTQNTHDPSVTHTAKGSLDSLNDFYGRGLDEEGALEGMTKLVENFDYNKLVIDKKLNFADKKKSALDFLSLLKKNANYVHSHTNFTHKKIYALIWRGVVDDNLEVFPSEIRRTIDPSLAKAPAYLIEIKQASLIEKFIDGDRIYRERKIAMDICSGGSIHKLLEALSQAHTHVTICTGDFSIEPAANKVPDQTLRRILKTLPIQQQRAILSTWNIEEDNNPGDKFRRSCIPIIDQDLQKTFGILLTEQQRNNITAAYNLWDRPDIHDGLANLIEDICKIAEDTGNAARQSAIVRLQNLVRHVYDASDRSFHDEYLLLAPIHKTFKELDEYIHSIVSMRDSEEVPEKFLIIKMKKLAEEGAKVAYAQEDWQEALTALKAKVDEEKAKLEALEAYIRSEVLIECREAVPQRYLIAKIKQYAQAAYASTDWEDALATLKQKVEAEKLKLESLKAYIQSILSTQDSEEIPQKFLIAKVKEIVQVASQVVYAQDDWEVALTTLRAKVDEEKLRAIETYREFILSIHRSEGACQKLIDKVNQYSQNAYTQENWLTVLTTLKQQLDEVEYMFIQDLEQSVIDHCDDQELKAAIQLMINQLRQDYNNNRVELKIEKNSPKWELLTRERNKILGQLYALQTLVDIVTSPNVELDRLQQAKEQFLSSCEHKIYSDTNRTRIAMVIGAITGMILGGILGVIVAILATGGTAALFVAPTTAYLGAKIGAGVGAAAVLGFVGLCSGEATENIKVTNWRNCFFAVGNAINNKSEDNSLRREYNELSVF